MKSRIFNTLAILTLLTLWCATGRAQTFNAPVLLYSNAFNIPGFTGPNVSVYNTPPTSYATNYLGASASAVWLCTYTNSNPAVTTAGTVYQNGDISTNQGVVQLPLSVRTNAVYILQAQIQLPGSSMTTEAEMGFCATNTASKNFNTIANCRFNDTPPTGYYWDYLKSASTAIEFFKGANAANGLTGGYWVQATFPAGTYNLQIVLDTLLTTNAYQITNAAVYGAPNETNFVAGFSSINGIPLSSADALLYTNNNQVPALPPLTYCGLGSAGGAAAGVSGVVWNYFTVSTPLAPIIVIQPNAANTANQGSAFTISTIALADTNGGALFYQWYTNGVALLNQTNPALVINPVTTNNISTNYYVVVTNTLGAVTSSTSSLFVYGFPAFTEAFPLTYTNLGSTNLMFIYGGSGAYAGSSPSFLVSASGASPIGYYWFTNGVPVAGATSTNFGLSNLSMTGPTTFACVISNNVGEATNYWAATYLSSPTTPFQAAVMAAQPIAYWRLNDTNLDGVDNGSGDDGYVCHDYVSGNDGIYTNVILNTTYGPTIDPTLNSAQFGNYNSMIGSEDANSIGGNNLDFSSKSNAEFTVALWANGGVAGGNEPQNGGLFAKGYFSGEECCIDTAPNSSYGVRLTLRNAAGTQVNAISSESLGNDSNWHFIVGTCDESNGLVSLYVDGVLAAQSSIPSNSGIINSANTPIIIGARSTSALDYGSQQFEGNMNDVALFGYALTASNVLSLYETAGGTVPPYFVPPLPPTVIAVPGTTNVTIAATVNGEPPFGYYWITNGNVANILGSGVSTIPAPLNASITIPGVPTNWWGYAVQLVVTNAYGTTNWSVTLTNPPPPPPTPITLPYTSSILYSNIFPVGTAEISLNGLAASGVNILEGGTNTTWVDTYTNIPNGQNGTVYADGTLGTNCGNALVPFTPETGFIYTMAGSLQALSTMNNWVAMGFTVTNSQFNTEVTTRFTDNPPQGYDWMYVQNAGATFEFGPNTSGGADSIAGVPTAPTTNLLQITLNTLTNNAWIAIASINGNLIGTNTYSGNNPPIAYAGIGQNQLTAGTAGLQWQYWTLTAVSPNGFPPYLLAPLPPTSNITLTNPTVTLNASGYGTGPWGYYWQNNATIVASGTTPNTQPLTANLSVPSSSLNGGTLELVLTNALGTNITLITLIPGVTVNPPPQLTATSTNILGVETLLLGWPNNSTNYYTGYQLQALTNKVSVGIETNSPVGNNWANFNPSTGTNLVAIPVNLTNGTVFYRLTY